MTWVRQKGPWLAWEGSAPILHEVPSPHGFVTAGWRSWIRGLNTAGSTKVFLNLVWAALNKSQKMQKGKGTHIYWSWLWRRYSHFKDGEVEVRSPLKVTVVDYITESVICFLLVRGWYISAHCYVACSVSLQESCYFPVPVVSGLADWRRLARGMWTGMVHSTALRAVAWFVPCSFPLRCKTKQRVFPWLICSDAKNTWCKALGTQDNCSDT